MKSFKDYFTLLRSTFFLSAFTFGGGFVIIPLMKKKFVDELGWIDDNEMMDLMAIAQSSPGSIAVNASIMIGYKSFGFFGALVATLGTVLPPLIILSVISQFYFAFSTNLYVAAALGAMQAGIAAVVLDVVYTMARTLFEKNKVINIVVLTLAFIFLHFLKVNVIYLIVLGAIIGVRFKLSEGSGKDASTH